MKTIKLPYSSNYDFDKLMKQFNSVVRFSYNRFKDNLTQKEIEKLVYNLNNINLCNKRILFFYKKFGNKIPNFIRIIN